MKEPSANDSIARVYGGNHYKADWAAWNRSTHDRGYWLLGAAAILIIVGIMLIIVRNKGSPQL